jgi:peptidyl-prolyl cis-trans isomerase A (cyclophilin A)
VPTDLVLATELGEIRIRLLEEQAPITTAHVRRLVEGHDLGPGTIYRVVDTELDGQPFRIVQGGWLEQVDRLPKVEHEAGAVPHRLGSVSLARFEPGTAASEWFITLTDAAPYLDPGAPPPMDGHGYAVFGLVVDGLELAYEVNGHPVGDEAPLPVLAGQMLAERVPYTARIESS